MRKCVSPLVALLVVLRVVARQAGAAPPARPPNYTSDLALPAESATTLMLSSRTILSDWFVNFADVLQKNLKFCTRNLVHSLN